MKISEMVGNNRPVVVVDGRRLTAQATGVGRYLSLLLDHWAERAASLPFEPVVILHRDRPRSMDRWKAVFRCEVLGSHSPGWVWENLHLAGGGRRDAVLFAPANLVPWRWRGPVVLVVHDTFCEHADARVGRLAKLRYRGRYRRAASRADFVLTPSHATADDVRRYFGVDPGRIRVVRPGMPDVPVSQAETDPQGMPDVPFVLFVGKVSARREFPAVMQAVESLASRGMNLRLVRVGPRCAGAACTELVADLGHVSDDILAGLYRRAQALVWPSAREGFGLPVLEAMAHGCPVITRPVNALAELCQGCCMELADARPETIAGAISRLMGDQRLRSSLIRRGLDRVKAFEARAFADEVAGAIAAACQSSSHQRGGTIGWNPGLGRRAVRIQH